MEYIDIIDVVNVELSPLVRDREEISEREIVRKIVSGNIPGSWKQGFASQVGNEMETRKDMKKKLTEIEQAYSLKHWESCKNSRKNNGKPELNGNGNKNYQKNYYEFIGQKIIPFTWI